MSEAVISADSHLDIGWLPADVFTSRAPRMWRDRMPKVVETEDGLRWVADGHVLSGVSGVGSRGRPYTPGRWQRGDRMASTGLYEDGLNRPANPEQRWRDQDLDGVIAEIIYGIFAVSVQLPDRELSAQIDYAFNEWMAEFCASKPDRYIGLASLPTHDPAATADEIRRASSLGLRGGVIDYMNCFEPVSHPAWDPVWAAAQELAFPISMHLSRKYTSTPTSAFGQFAAPNDHQRPQAALENVASQIQSAPMCFGIVLGGALDRFPGLQIVLGESGIGWIAYFLERLDYEYDNEYRDIRLSLKPSDYWHRQMFATFQVDEVGLHLLDYLGDDRVMFASDYPHPDGIWPDSLQFVEKHMAHLSPESRRRVLCDNVARLYQINL